MIICYNCEYKNREGTLFCEDCGINLVKKVKVVPLSTRMMQSSALPPARSGSKWLGQSQPAPRVGVTHFMKDSQSVMVQIQGASTPIAITPNKRMVFGRADGEVGPDTPDIDLTPYGAVDMGVSRRHAAIELNEETLILMDIGSRNGTFLNGQRISANQSRILRDGDEVRFGKMIAHVYFK